ncbi:MAG: tetratricopeptide repeat protein [Candidatus Sericytochromatia bacterium]
MEQNPEIALAFYQQALDLHPDFWACRNNLAWVLQNLGRLKEAKAQFVWALADCPEDRAQAQIWESLGDLCLAENTQQATQEALNAYQKALETAPQTLRLYMKLSRLWRAQGQLPAAIQTLQKLSYLAPERASIWLALAELQMANLQFISAEASLERALLKSASDREKAHICLQLAHAQSESGKLAEAQQSLQRGVKFSAFDGFKLAQLSLLPPVYQSQTELLQTRQAWEAALETLAQSAEPLQIVDPVAEVGSLPFYLPYQGFNDCRALSLLSDLYKQFLPPEPGLLPPSNSSRLKVACVSHYFHTHSLMQCFGGLLENLSQEHFELGCFSLSPLVSDATTERMRQRADFWSELPPNLADQLQTIRRWQPDILLYTDLGPHLPTWLLGQYRLAPVQWVFPGHPVTSGSAQIDGFISSKWLDTAEGQSHYREKLLRPEILPTFVTAPLLPARQNIREKWGLPNHKNLYLCPVSLFKLHPEMDPLFGEILARDPQGLILLLDRPQSGLDTRLKARFSKSMGPQSERIWFLPWLNPHDFLQLLLNAEVYLETFPFGSGTTLFSAFACGIPVVALAPIFARGRFAAMFYHQMGLGELIAQNPADYIDKAFNWANDSDLRGAVSQAILAKNPHIFLFQPALRSFERALMEAHLATGGRSL